MLSVAQEIHYLSAITGTSCSDWKHLLVADKVNDPLDAPGLREGHLLHGGSALRDVAESVLAGHGISRRLECASDNCFLVAADKAETFESVAAQFGFGVEWGDIPTTKSIFGFVVPDNFTWVVTQIFLRSLPPINDASLTAAGTSSGDFRSGDFDVNGLSQAWLTVNGKAIMSQELTTGWIGKPMLLAFANKSNVQLMVTRYPDSIPAEQIVHTVFHGYLARSPVYSQLEWCQTSVEGTFEANP